MTCGLLFGCLVDWPFDSLIDYVVLVVSNQQVTIGFISFK
jgi:hypothetical protein